MALMSCHGVFCFNVAWVGVMYVFMSSMFSLEKKVFQRVEFNRSIRAPERSRCPLFQDS